MTATYAEMDAPAVQALLMGVDAAHYACVDVRSPQEHASAHIPQTRNIPLVIIACSAVATGSYDYCVLREWQPIGDGVCVFATTGIYMYQSCWWHRCMDGAWASHCARWCVSGPDFVFLGKDGIL